MEKVVLIGKTNQWLLFFDEKTVKSLGDHEVSKSSFERKILFGEVPKDLINAILDDDKGSAIRACCTIVMSVFAQACRDSGLPKEIIDIIQGMCDPEPASVLKK